MSKDLSKIAVALGMSADSALDDIIHRAAAVTADAMPDVADPHAGDAFHAAFDRIEARVKGGERLRVDVFLTDPDNLAADVYGSDGVPLAPMDQLAALILLRCSCASIVGKVAEMGIDAWTEGQIESAVKRGAPVGPLPVPTDPTLVSA